MLMEAESVEDKGEGVEFCVFVYNAQPGVTIDYATGDSWLDENGTGSQKLLRKRPKLWQRQKPRQKNRLRLKTLRHQQKETSTYILNTNSKNSINRAVPLCHR